MTPRTRWKFRLATDIALASLGVVIAGGSGSSAFAAVTPAGDTTLGTTFSSPTYVGRNANGTLDIDGGSTLNGLQSYVGHNSGASGTVSVRGSGSTWTSSNLRVGNSGSGTLMVQDGATVSTSVSELGSLSGSIGTASVTGTGSTWASNTRLIVGHDGTGALTVADGGLVSAKTLYADLADLSGNGTISATGAVLDADLVFDATHGTAQTLAFGSGGSLNLSISNQGGELGVGHQGVGTLRVGDGVLVISADGYLGAWKGSSGAATITGAGSKWRTGSSVIADLYVGSFGTGSLRIEAGGEGTSRDAYVASQVGSAGTTTVTGTGSKWTISRQLYIGRSGVGALNIEDGGLVTSDGAYVGQNARSTGSVTVSGAGSKWNNTSELHVGYGGSGSLTVSNGGSIVTKSIFGSLDDLHGDGSITVEGAVLDEDLTFDQTHGTTRAIAFGSGGVLDLTLKRTAPLGVGYKGSNTLLITDGVRVPSFGGYLGYQAGSTGAATVRGAASTWDSSELHVGHSGNGLLKIEAGALVQSNYGGYVAYNSGSTGTVLMSGAGSTWENNTDLYIGFRGAGTLRVSNGAKVSGISGFVGFHEGSNGLAVVRGSNSAWASAAAVDVGVYGSGTLSVEAGGAVSTHEFTVGHNAGAVGNLVVKGQGSRVTTSDWLVVGDSGRGTLTVSDGGKVNAGRIRVNSQSAVRVHVSGDGMLAGSLTNNGTVTMYADAMLPPAAYRPISSAPSGTGTYQAVGGVWDAAGSTFTVSPATALTAGASDSVGRGERMLVTDSTTGRRVGASFGTVSDGVNFSAVPGSADESISLVALLGTNKQVIESWDFTTNFSGGGEVLLSFDVGTGAQDLEIWHVEAGTWTPYTPATLNYDSRGIVSFTVNSFSGYAVTAAVVPEPAGLAIVCLGNVALLRRRPLRRR